MTIKVGDRVPDATLTEFIETETSAMELLSAMDGWEGFAEITQEEYNKLNS